MAVFTSAVLPNSTQADHAGLQPYIFFEASDFFNDEVDLHKPHDADYDENKDPSPTSPLPSISFARRAARCGKAALVALKYIATHELTGVLQPIAHSLKSTMYLLKRQVPNDASFDMND